MKKHDFNSAIEIFKQMFEGWMVVHKQGTKHDLKGVDLVDSAMTLDGYGFEDSSEISHLEQTKPINGDEVWAWEDGFAKHKRIYIGKTKNGLHVCSNEENSCSAIWGNVELISPIRQLTIQEATEIIRKGEKVEEPFEIIKE